MQGVPLHSIACKFSEHGLEPSGAWAPSATLAIQRASWFESRDRLEAAQAIRIRVWATEDVTQQSELLSADEFCKTREFCASKHFRVRDPAPICGLDLQNASEAPGVYVL